MEKLEATDSSVELDEWDVGADGIPVRKGDHVTEEGDGRKTYFV